MPEDSPIPIAASSKSGRVVRRKKAGSKVKRGKAKSTLRNDQRKLKKVTKHSSSGADEMYGGMESHQPMLLRSVESAADGKRNYDLQLMVCKGKILKYSKVALEFYHNKNQEDDEFEVVQALHAQQRLLYPGGSEDDTMEEWCHVFFVGQSKKDGSVERNFFAELMRSESECEFSVKSCFTLEPSGNDLHHGCIICPPGLLLHPQKGKFEADFSSFTPVTWVMD